MSAYSEGEVKRKGGVLSIERGQLAHMKDCRCKRRNENEGELCHRRSGLTASSEGGESRGG